MKAGRSPRLQTRIRMYRTGLGDCFLLSFQRGSRGNFHVLIDCGVLHGSGDSRMNRIAGDIRDLTGGKLDLLVVTHEHWDHLSGFSQARKIFQDISVERLWLAWTEAPGVLPEQLRTARARVATALRLAVTRVHSMAPEFSNRVQAVLDFQPLAASGRRMTTDTLDFLRKQAKKCEYKNPGETVKFEPLPEVRFYVLGPPKDLKSLFRRDIINERYSVAEFNLESSFFAAALGLEDLKQIFEAGVDSKAEHSPFQRFGISRDTAGQEECFRRYLEKSEAWRRIDDGWLNPMGTLAMRLDSDTNNTSLALAIEIVETGQVLLFPGDAQVGNWMSWAEHTWQVEDGAATKEVRVEHLLSRTVLYKVGHHGSHNATLRQRGLELMIHKDLVAMVPVDTSISEKMGWEMPFPRLYDALARRTKGRLLMNADNNDDRQELLQRYRGREYGEFSSRVNETELYFDYLLP